MTRLIIPFNLFDHLSRILIDPKRFVWHYREVQSILSERSWQIQGSIDVEVTGKFWTRRSALSAALRWGR
jgi:hypothetical protein